jgi:flagellar biosynthetic protein FlhB
VAESSGEKKHYATERRREQARQNGQIVRSQDLTSAALLIAALMTFWLLGGTTVKTLIQSFADSLSSVTLKLGGTSDAVNLLIRYSTTFAVAALPILVVMAFAGILVNVMQTGILITPERLMPKLENISPLAGAKRILSLQSVMRLGFGLFKLMIVAWVAYAAIMKYRDTILGMSSLGIAQIAELLYDATVGTSWWIGGSLLTLALFEYGFQKWKYEQDLMMTDQELREEMKDSEGNPLIKSRRKQIQRQMAMQQMKTDVPKADVVVTNPTELAIAIKYDPVEMQAPIVVAKGAGVMAQKIRRIALENAIPIVERKPLAQVLYKAVKVGSVIPIEQYAAVAEVLRYVYQLQGKAVPKVTGQGERVK